MLARKKLGKGDATSLYYGTVVLYDLPSRRPTRKGDEDKVLEANVARFSKFALQMRVLGRRFNQITERLVKDKAASCVSAAYFV